MASTENEGPKQKIEKGTKGLKIEKIKLFRLRAPLSEPYKLSYGPLEEIQPVVCRMESADHRVGWGESTILPGYCTETLDELWETSVKGATQLLRCSNDEICGTQRFARAALQGALDDLQGAVPLAERGGKVPIAALIQGESVEIELERIRKAREDGFRTYKIKTGWGSAELQGIRIKRLQEALVSGEWLRIDANQGLSFDVASQLMNDCDPARVQFMEQPIPKEDVDGLLRLSRMERIPILLDESIVDINSVEQFVAKGFRGGMKLKLMKVGGWAALENICRRIGDSGCQVILGNGVSTAIGNRAEAVFWGDVLEAAPWGNLAGEMSGFAKVSSGVKDTSMTMAYGHLVVTSGGPEVAIDENCVEKVWEKSKQK